MEKVITEEKRLLSVYTVSNSRNSNKVLTKFCFPTHILPQVTLEKVPLKLVGSRLFNVSKALDLGGQGRFLPGHSHQGLSRFPLAGLKRALPFHV